MAFKFTTVGRQHLLAAEGQQLSDQGSGTIAGVGNLLDRSAQRRVGTDALQQELAIPGHHHEQIIEIVRDAACETAHCFHLLRLAELLLKGTTLSYVFGEKLEEDGIAFAAYGTSGKADDDGTPILSHPLRHQP